MLSISSDNRTLLSPELEIFLQHGNQPKQPTTTVTTTRAGEHTVADEPKWEKELGGDGGGKPPGRRVAFKEAIEVVEPVQGEDSRNYHQDASIAEKDVRSNAVGERTVHQPVGKGTAKAVAPAADNNEQGEWSRGVHPASFEHSGRYNQERVQGGAERTVKDEGCYKEQHLDGGTSNDVNNNNANTSQHTYANNRRRAGTSGERTGGSNSGRGWAFGVLGLIGLILAFSPASNTANTTNNYTPYSRAVIEKWRV